MHGYKEVHEALYQIVKMLRQGNHGLKWKYIKVGPYSSDFLTDNSVYTVLRIITYWEHD